AQAKAADERLADARAKIAELEARAATDTEALAKAAEKFHATAQGGDEAVQRLEAEVCAAEAERDEARAALDKALDEAAALEAEHKNLEAERDALAAQLAEAQDALQTARDQLAAAEDRVSALTENLGAMNDAKAQIREMQDTIPDLRQAIRQHQEEIIQLQQTIVASQTATTHDSETGKEFLDGLIKSRAILSSLDSKIDSAALNEELTTLKREIDRLQYLAHEDLGLRDETVSQSIDNLVLLLNSRNIEVERKVSEISRLKEEIRMLEERIQAKDNKILEYKDALNERLDWTYNSDPGEETLALRDEVQKLTDDLHYTEDELARVITAVGQLEHALTKLREANIEKNSELVRLRNLLHENNINFALNTSASDSRINTSLQQLSELKNDLYAKSKEVESSIIGKDSYITSQEATSLKEELSRLKKELAEKDYIIAELQKAKLPET
ncbi:Hypothetical protein GSB_151937, partial [Giardia duodenalis]